VAEKNRIEVFIGGKVYKIAGEESEEYMQKVARYIDKKMQEVSGAERATVLSTSMISVLTAINVADDYFKLMEENKVLKEQINQLNREKELNSDKKLDDYENLIGQLQDENIALKEKLDEVIIELKDTKNEFDEYIETFGRETKSD